jgi:hypothetical protein
MKEEILRFLSILERRKKCQKQQRATQERRLVPGKSCVACVLHMAGFVRSVVSKKKKRFVEDGFDLDLTYITPRIIAMGFPSSGMEGIYRNPLPEVQRFFAKRHAGHYKVHIFILPLILSFVKGISL